MSQNAATPALTQSYTVVLTSRLHVALSGFFDLSRSNRASTRDPVLLNRSFEADSGVVLYHYCSAATFQAIATSGTIRFTDINMLNDASEVRLAYSIFEEAATRVIKREGIPTSFPTIAIDFIDRIDKIISPIQLIAHPFITCFSRDPDLLGQWRAYADNGRGYALGFSADLLKQQLAVTWVRVLYDREDQVKEMIAAIGAMFLRQRDGTAEERAEFAEDCVLLATLMTAFKHPAFQEEQEIRAVHAIGVKPQGTLIRFADEGGTNGSGQIVAGEQVSFQVRENHLVAYLDAKVGTGDSSPLVEVVLGPQNHSAPGNLQLFLGGVGLTRIALRRSAVPYR